MAILASTACVSAAPAAAMTENSLVTRGDANEILTLLEDLKKTHSKRDLASESEHFELSKRADGLATELVSALASSGIIEDVWTTFTEDEALKSEIVTVVKSTIKAALVQGPALIKAVWNSGLLTKIFKDVFNDSELRSVLLKVAKSAFTTGLNLFKAYKSGSSSSSATTTDAAVATAVATDSATTAVDISNIPSPSQYASGSKRDFIDGEYLSKRDVASIVSAVATQIKESGLVSNIIQKILADPEKSISLLTTVLKKGYVIAGDLFSWAKSSGVLEKGLQYLENNGGDYTSEIASFLGSQIEGGNLTTSEIDNAGSSSSGTTIATTATATALTTGTTLSQVRTAY